MLINEDKIKSFHKQLLKQYFPTQKHIVAKYTDNHYGKLDNDTLKKDFDKHLEECLDGIYKERLATESTLTKNYINSLTQSKENYPSLYNLFKDINSNNVHRIIQPFMKLGQSLEQSRKSRAGATLELVLETFFNKLNLKFESQKKLIGERADFVCPDIDYVSNQKHNSMVLECQTTLKDRFRLTSGKILNMKEIKKYLVTATGLGLYTKSDVNDLSIGKIREYLDNSDNNYFVVFSQVKKKFSSELDNYYLQRIFSFSEFITDYQKNQESWET